MQPDESPTLEEASETFARNHKTLLSVLQGGRHNGDPSSIFQNEVDLKLSLERILINRADKSMVPYAGETGIEALLAHLGKQYEDCSPEQDDGHLVALRVRHAVADDDEVVLYVSVCAGGQISCTIGPSTSVAELYEALLAFDRKVHVAAREMGCDYYFLSEGYNPLVSMPLDVPLVPRTRWTLLNAYLSQTGRYARDAMRCSCSTRLSLSYTKERLTLDAYRLGTALSPLITFLTDNVRSFRGSGARRCPRMVRSLIWDEVDPARCSIVPGSFDPEFSFESYLSWMEGLKPILFVDAMGTTTSTAKLTIREIMEQRVFSSSEALRLFDVVMPPVRLNRMVDICQADALRPSLAAGYASFIKGLFCSELSINSARSVLGPVTEHDVELATHELRIHGWDAVIYGKRVQDLLYELLQIVHSSLDDASERRLLDHITELWDVCMVPRDVFVAQEIKAERGW